MRKKKIKFQSRDVVGRHKRCQGDRKAMVLCVCVCVWVSGQGKRCQGDRKAMVLCVCVGRVRDAREIGRLWWVGGWAG